MCGGSDVLLWIWKNFHVPAQHTTYIHILKGWFCNVQPRESWHVAQAYWWRSCRLGSFEDLGGRYVRYSVMGNWQKDLCRSVREEEMPGDMYTGTPGTLSLYLLICLKTNQLTFVVICYECFCYIFLKSAQNSCNPLWSVMFSRDGGAIKADPYERCSNDTADFDVDESWEEMRRIILPFPWRIHSCVQDHTYTLSVHRYYNYIMDIITYCNDNDNDNVVDEILVMLVLGPDWQSAAQVRHACAAQHPFCPSAALGGDFMGKSSTWGLNQPSMVVEWE